MGRAAAKLRTCLQWRKAAALDDLRSKCWSHYYDGFAYVSVHYAGAGEAGEAGERRNVQCEKVCWSASLGPPGEGAAVAKREGRERTRAAVIHYIYHKKEQQHHCIFQNMAA